MSEEKVEKKVPLTQEEAKMRKSLLTKENGAYNIKYDLVLTIRRTTDKLESEKHDFEGVLNISFEYYPKSDLKDPFLFLNFVGEIHYLEYNGTKANNFIYEKNRLIIDLTLLKPNESNILKIIFSGDYNHNGVGLHQYTDPSDKKEYLYTQFEPYDCNRLFPVFDQPNLKAVLDLKVIAPKEWIVLSNAHEKDVFDFKIEKCREKIALCPESIKHLFETHSIENRNYHMYIFNATPRISSYLYALCSGPYYCIENKNHEFRVPLRLFMRESLKDCGEPDEIFRVTIAGMKFYEDYFGTPFQFDKYDQIFCPEYNMGAMENVGLITLNELYCWKDKPTQRRRTGFAITILHELAHMWFGDYVTMNWWNDLWLNESFATFISHFCMANSVDLKESYQTSWILFGDYKGYAYSADQKSTTHPVMSEVKDTDVAETEFDLIVYEKGSSIVKQMYYVIGDEAFSKGLKTYFKKYGWNNTVFDDFINEMIDAAGDKLQNLKDMCHLWLQKAGLNEISLNMEINPQTNLITKFVVNQKPCLEQHPNLIYHMVDFLFIYDFEDFSKNKVFEKQLIEAKNETVFDFSKEIPPKAVFLNYNDYGYMKLDFDKRSLEGLKEGLPLLKDILIKQSIYRSLFDQMRDGKFTSVEYVELAFALIHTESNDNNLSLLLRHTHSAIASYIHFKYMIRYKKKFFLHLKTIIDHELSKIEYSQDIIKQILQFMPANVTNEEDRKILIRLLNLDSKIVSQDNRFSFVKNIYKSKDIPLEIKENVLNEEIKRDKNSSKSVQAKLCCNSLLPDKKNKEKIWNKITKESASDSLYNMIEIMNGFAPFDQVDLIKDYCCNKFFEVLPEIGKKNEVFFVESFVQSCGPSNYFVNEENIKKMEDLCQKIKDMHQVKKAVMEEIDDMKRCFKCHKLCEEYVQSRAPRFLSTVSDTMKNK